MRSRSYIAVALVVAVAVVSGCLHGGAEDVRDGFVEAADDVESYEVESELVFEISAGPGTVPQTTTSSTDAVVDRGGEALEVEQVTERVEGDDVRSSDTTTYVVDGVLYERTVAGEQDSGWLRYDSAVEVEREWESRDRVAFYQEVLEDASVSSVDEDVDGELLDVELSGEAKVNYLAGNFDEDPEFFERADVQEFSLQVYVDDGSLRSAEADASLTVERQGEGPSELQLTVEAIDEFRSYGEVDEVVLPEETEDAEPVR